MKSHVKSHITRTALALSLLSGIVACQPGTQSLQDPPATAAQPLPQVVPVAAPATVANADTAPSPQAASAPAPAATAAAPASAVPANATGKLPLVVVHKSPTCGCCHLWVEHMQKAGFTVDVRDTDDLNTVKERVGVPLGKGSCHTAEVDGYFVEGHVPAEDVRRMLATRPKARGLVLPGMPAGSPGMELPDGRVDPYTVELVGRDGSTTPFASHPK